MENRLSFLH